MVIGDEKPIDRRPADLIGPEMANAKAELGELAQSEEDVISYAVFGQVTREFLQRRAAGGLAATDPAVAAIAALVAQKEDMLQAPAAEQGRPQVQLATAPSTWRAGSRPRIRQIGGLPRW